MHFFQKITLLALIFFLFACSDKSADKADDESHPSFSELPEITDESGQDFAQAVVPVAILPEDKEKANNAPEGMVFIKGGCFIMGNDYTQEDEKPEHEVCLSDFYMDKFEVTQARWEKVMGFNPSKFSGANLPVEQVNYQNVQKFIKKSGGNCRLPTEAEWEYAARGGLESATYPWGGPYTKNDRGCFRANFKPLRGDYAADQALYTVEAKSYEPNGFGLYNMAGNVSEWVDSSYEPSSYDFSSNMNPNVNDTGNLRKVLRGGSWKDIAYFLQVSSRDYEYADSARSYIGFRNVQDYMGTDVVLNEKLGDAR